VRYVLDKVRLQLTINRKNKKKQRLMYLDNLITGLNPVAKWMVRVYGLASCVFGCRPIHCFGLEKKNGPDLNRVSRRLRRRMTGGRRDRSFPPLFPDTRAERERIGEGLPAPPLLVELLTSTSRSRPYISSIIPVTGLMASRHSQTVFRSRLNIIYIDQTINPSEW
jgi:hypothetical protein